MQTAQIQRRRAGDLSEQIGNAIRVDGFGRLTEQPKYHRLVGIVAFSSECEGTVQRNGDAHHVFEQSVCLEPVDETPGGRHRPHRMGTRRPDTDLEHVEDTEKHAPLPSRWRTMA